MPTSRKPRAAPAPANRLTAAAPKAKAGKAKKQTPAITLLPGAGRGGIIPPLETRWKPGQSGNPTGRAKGAVILSKAYYARLAETVPGDPQERTYAELVAAGQINAAIKGNTAAAAEVRKSTEGDKVIITEQDIDSAIEDELARVAAERQAKTADAATGAESDEPGGDNPA